MKTISKLNGLLCALLLSGSVYAADIKVDGAWARATAPGQEVAMADLSITSDQPAQLVGITSPVCKTVEIHSMTHDNGMMKMRQVQSLDLPAGKRVNLGLGGYHLMLIGLKTPLKLGDSVPLTLNIKGAGKAIVKVEAAAEVKPLTEAAPQSQEHMEHMDHMHNMDHMNH